MFIEKPVEKTEIRAIRTGYEEDQIETKIERIKLLEDKEAVPVIG